jgi:O-acetyl-ADP-ribose deacetylase (regulator of RNase III)
MGRQEGKIMREILYEHHTPAGQIVRVGQGDLTDEAVDAIVNAANEYLAHGGGVAGAIVRKGGYSIQVQSNQWVQEHGPVHTGTAAITEAGQLPTKWVIHAVGPVWRDQGDEPELLANAVRSALEIATAHGLESVSLPAISSGIFGFPKPLCAEVMWTTTLDYLAAYPEGSVREINFCSLDRHTVDIFYAEAMRRFGEQT